MTANAVPGGATTHRESARPEGEALERGATLITRLVVIENGRAPLLDVAKQAASDLDWPQRKVSAALAYGQSSGRFDVDYVTMEIVASEDR